MRSLLPSLALVSIVTAFGCGTPVEDGWTRPASPPSPRALGALQTRDHKVTLLPGHRVRVEDARGAIVADGVTVDDLAKIDPFLHAACTNATAGFAPSGRGTYVDARLDRPVHAEPAHAGSIRADLW